jgi:DNA-binding NarL/FixJ family response regulator
VAEDSAALARDVREPATSLTPQMVSFLAAHASGRTLTAVAMEMHYSYSNVRNTLDEAKSRLGCNTLAAAVMRAHALGYLTHPTGAEQRVFACTA